MEAAKHAAPATPATSGLLGRNQFLIYRLFSLAGFMPIGGYVVVHLLTNATVVDSPATFQNSVNRIHSLGIILPLVEWTFIFLPIIFHAAVGLWIISGGLPNVGSYPYGSNVRYTLQRATGMVAMAFIVAHLWHLHYLGKAFGGGEFDAHHAASSTAEALVPIWWKIFYAVGVVSVAFHLGNGLWTFGITWGIWTSDGAQRRAGFVCAAIGLIVGSVGLTALWGFSRVNVEDARIVENRMRLANEMLEGKIAIEPAGSGQPTAGGEQRSAGGE